MREFFQLDSNSLGLEREEGLFVTRCYRLQKIYERYLHLDWTEKEWNSSAGFTMRQVVVTVSWVWVVGSWIKNRVGILLAQRTRRSLAPSPMRQDRTRSYINIAVLEYSLLLRAECCPEAKHSGTHMVVPGGFAAVWCLIWEFNLWQGLGGP